MTGADHWSILITTTAGAPFLPKLARFSDAIVAVGVGLTVLANVSTQFNVMAMTLAISLVGLGILMIVSGEIGKRTLHCNDAR